jgi:hypothetical protein
MVNRCWLIRGYDGATLIYEKMVPFACLTEKQVQSLLQTLTAKAGLTNDEIVAAYARGGAKLHNSHLGVRRDCNQCMFSCGNNPYFIALTIDGI